MLVITKKQYEADLSLRDKLIISCREFALKSKGKHKKHWKLLISQLERNVVDLASVEDEILFEEIERKNRQ